jgi:hypothetical protein
MKLPETPESFAAAMEARRKYNVIRFYRDAYPRRRIIDSGLTLAEAQAHCSNPETSSSTAAGKVAKARTRRLGAWFDGYEESR